ncbi:hypothetical protein CVT26_010024 [Gymnopilus dilepis]|uniref:Uncharacterized protein n=1 Tax=Gymnopilus dilepis TaxID=231916 RepID=A0A409VL41_9AGAR|nr:hypothetical protein CVT26_010024 [Gymnopilus dilepis]
MKYLFNHTLRLGGGFHALEVVDDQAFLNKRLALPAEYQREMSLGWGLSHLHLARGYTCIDVPVMMGATVIRAILVL